MTVGYFHCDKTLYAFRAAEGRNSQLPRNGEIGGEAAKIANDLEEFLLSGWTFRATLFFTVTSEQVSVSNRMARKQATRTLPFLTSRRHPRKRFNVQALGRLVFFVPCTFPIVHLFADRSQKRCTLSVV